MQHTRISRQPIMATEPHYTPADLARRWGYHPDTLRRIFRAEPGVLKTGTVRTVLRIPESVAQRVHERLSA